MSLPTNADCANQPRNDPHPLVTAVLNRHRTIHANEALTAATKTLARHGLIDPLRITPQHNAHVYTGIQRVEDTTGATIRLPKRVLKRLDVALDKPLAQLTYDDRPGPTTHITIDLIAQTVTPNNQGLLHERVTGWVTQPERLARS